MPQKRTNGRRLMVERLESRSLLAGNITAEVVDGVLHVTGDNLANQLEITQTQFNSGGEWNGVTLTLRGRNLAGDATTTINGGAGGDFAGVKNGVHIRLNGGYDLLVVRKDQNNRAPNLPGQVFISGGHGNDDFHIYARNQSHMGVYPGWGTDDVLISGSTLSRLTVNTASQTGAEQNAGGGDDVNLRGVTARAVAINGGAGDDEIDFTNRCVFDGPVTVGLGEGDNLLSFSAPAQNGDPTLNGTFTYLGGAERDTVLAAGGVFNGDVRINTGDWEDGVVYFGTTTANTLEINTGDDDDRVVLVGVLGDGTVDGGAGHDELSRPENTNPNLSILNFENVHS